MNNTKNDRRKSAKDIAFDKERLKFRREIESLKNDKRYWMTECDGESAKRNECMKVIEEQEQQITELTKMIGIDKDELLSHIKRVKELKSSIDGIKGLGQILGGMY